MKRKCDSIRLYNEENPERPRKRQKFYDEYVEELVEDLTEEEEPMQIENQSSCEIV